MQILLRSKHKAMFLLPFRSSEYIATVTAWVTKYYPGLTVAQGYPYEVSDIMFLPYSNDHISERAMCDAHLDV
jgi:hypothetical protein